MRNSLFCQQRVLFCSEFFDLSRVAKYINANGYKQLVNKPWR